MTVLPLWFGGALAHAHLVGASPAAGATVSAPSEIRIDFSEAVEPKFSGITLAGPRGAVPLGKANAAPGDSKAMIAKVGAALAPGLYTVKWRAVSVDTHRTQGEFSFTVK